MRSEKKSNWARMRHFWTASDVQTPEVKDANVGLDGTSEDGEALQVYLLDVVSASYDREIDQDETVWRSLPIFGASLIGLGAAFSTLLLGFVTKPPSPLLAVPVWVLAVAAAAAIMSTLYFLWFATRGRPHVHPEFETDLCDFEQKTRRFHSSSAPAALDKVVLSALRNARINALAAAATNNRQLNARKVHGRTKAMVSLLASILFVLSLAAVRLVQVAREPKEPHLVSDESNPSQGTPATGTTNPAPPAPAEAPPPPPQLVIVIEGDVTGLPRGGQ